ncbi:hypothetical protein [Pedobacter nototheniae]|uniref:hypothetical protein n=1 Tax=Pedobacter nototheniae TaxID=2488994 RepID=UPI00292DD204|nr:hypothetical protein [Pedobacter nototheniae]
MRNLLISAFLLSFLTQPLDCLTAKTTKKQSETCLISTSETKFLNQKKPTESVSCTYDIQGRVIDLKSVDTERNYTYNNTEIIEKYGYNGGEKRWITVHHKLDPKGRIISSENPLINIRYSYDNNGYLAKSVYFSNGIYQKSSKYIITNGSLQKMENNTEEESPEDVDIIAVSSSNELFPNNFHYNIKDLPFEFTGVLRYYYGKPLKKLIIKTKTPGLSPVFYAYKKDSKGNIIQAKATATYEKVETDLIDIKYNCK